MKNQGLPVSQLFITGAAGLTGRAGREDPRIDPGKGTEQRQGLLQGPVRRGGCFREMGGVDPVDQGNDEIKY